MRFIPRPVNIIKGLYGAAYIGYCAFLKRKIESEEMPNGVMRYQTYRRVK